MVTRDVAATQIEESPLKVNSLGQEELISVVKERVTGPSEDGYHKKLQGPLRKN